MSIESTLTQIGLTTNQAKIYLTALSEGESSITELARASNLKRATAHLVIEELEMKGLLSGTRRGKRRMFAAVHPRKLLQIAQNTERRIEEVFPQLVALHTADTNKPKIQVFEGEEGVKQVYKDVYDAISSRKEMLGYARIENLKNIPIALTEYKKVIRRVRNPKIRELHQGPNSRVWANDTKILRGDKHELRKIPDNFEFGATDTILFDDKVVMFSVSDNVFAIVIKSKEIYTTQKALFECVWQLSEPM